MTDGLWGALISGAVALLLWFLQSRVTRRSWNDAWQQQAEELRNELRESHKDTIAAKDATITYLQGQIRAKDDANRALLGQVAELQPPRHGGVDE